MARLYVSMLKVELPEIRFSVDGTLIQAWTGHKSFVRKDGDGEANDGTHVHGECRINDTHASRTDAGLHCKGDNASRLRYMGHTLTDNLHGLVANAMVAVADGFAEREAAKSMINDARQSADYRHAEIARGSDKGYDARAFIEAMQAESVNPHVAHKTPRDGARRCRTPSLPARAMPFQRRRES